MLCWDRSPLVQASRASTAPQIWDGSCTGAVLLTPLAKPGFQWNPQQHQLPISKCWIYILKQEQRANPWANETWRKRAVFKLGIHLSNIYILDISNIQIAGWASLNLVWKQTPSALCLLTWDFFICIWPLLPSYLWQYTSSKGTEDLSLPCPPTCRSVLLFPHIQQTAVTPELLLPGYLFSCHH